MIIKTILKLSFLLLINALVFAQRSGTRVKVESIGEISANDLQKIQNSLPTTNSRLRSERMGFVKKYQLEKKELNKSIPQYWPGKPKENNWDNWKGLAQNRHQDLLPPLPAGITGGELEKTPAPEVSWVAPSSNDGDVNLAVSTTHILVSTCNYLEFFERMGNTSVIGIDVPQFFKELLTNPKDSLKTNDTRCIYDKFRDRFWIVTQKNTNIMLLAVSKTSNPKDGFYRYSLYATAQKGIDYPEIGISNNVFTITNWQSTYMFNANSLAMGIGPFVGKSYNLTTPSGEPFTGRVAPVNQYEESPYVYFTGIDPTKNIVYVFRYENSLTDNPVIKSWASAIDPITNLHTKVDVIAPNFCGPQKDSKVNLWFDNLTGVVLSACLRKGDLTFAMQQGYLWDKSGKHESAVHIIRLHLTSNNITCNLNQIVGNDYLGAKIAKTSFTKWAGFPSVASNKNGDILTCFARTGTDIYPEASYAGMRFNRHRFLGINTLKAGEKPYTSYNMEHDSGWSLPPLTYVRLPWADCSGICIDPLDDESFWIANVFGNSANDENIGVCVGKVKL